MLLPQFFAPFHTLSSERGSFADEGKTQVWFIFFQAAGCAKTWPGAGWGKVALLELPWGSAQLIPFRNIQVRQLPAF